MNLDVIKAKLEALNSDGHNSNGDTSKYFWKPEMGKSIVRIVPSMYDRDNPFTELRFHQNKGMVKYPLLALSNMGQQDPVEEFIVKLRETSDRENWSLSGKLEPRSRYFVPVIVRGEEEKGVRLWNIGITLYKGLMTLAANDEIGDYTDITNGRDIVVTKVNGEPYPETSIMPKMSTSPLSTDASLVEKWTTEQPRPIDCFKHYDYAYIKKMLETFLTGGKQPVEKVDVETRAETEAPTPVSTTFSAKIGTDAAPVEKSVTEAAPKATKQPKAAPKSAAAKFEDLFGDDSSESEDDLPF